MEIRALHPDDDRASFRSSDDDLDRFLHKFAGQNQFRHHIGTTYVAVEARRVVGYATVAAGHVEIDDLPASIAKRMPRYPLPILRLGRLAVDERERGRGIGHQLLRYVLALSLRMRDDFGCVAVIVDAKPGAERFYARFGFSPLDAVEGQGESRPRPTAMVLPVREIDAASRR